MTLHFFIFYYDLASTGHEHTRPATTVESLSLFLL